MEKPALVCVVPDMVTTETTKVRLATRSKPKVTKTMSWMRCDEKLDRLVSGSTKCGSHATPQAIIWRNGVEQLSRERVKRRGLSV